MSVDAKPISSDDLIPIEHHFRVSAGPGAGKTHWLINHIKNVLHKSDRLGKTRKIACITYTNIAVEIILSRLGSSADRVEVSTIHSFLYKHIVKPYVSFIAEKYGLDVKEMDGHDEHVVSYSKVSNWIDRDYRSLKYLYDDMKLTFYHLKGLKWTLDGSEMKLKITKRKDGYKIIKKKKEVIIPFLSDDRQDKLLSYKKLYWQEGIIHYDDVLFFSYQLIIRFPFILHALRAKFPYFFIDEFQDTNPIQAKILELLGQAETIIGIIGDKAQSIFNFQGATPEKFSSFNLPGIVDYQIADNRRSTNQIIDFLNCIRKDISQKTIRKKDGRQPLIITGDMVKSLCKAGELCDKNHEICSLAWENIISNSMKRYMNHYPSEDFLEKLYKTDSSKNRRKIITACIKATELARQNRFKEAIKEMVRVSPDRKDKTKAMKKALGHIVYLLENYAAFKDTYLSELVMIINDKVMKIPKLRSGNIKKFYESILYNQIAVCVKIKEDPSLHRTIHKAKGAEFDNVLLILKDEKSLDFIYSPDLENNEKHRLYYVAVSRARENVFISVPSVTKKKTINKLKKLNIEII